MMTMYLGMARFALNAGDKPLALAALRCALSEANRQNARQHMRCIMRALNYARAI